MNTSNSSGNKQLKEIFNRSLVTEMALRVTANHPEFKANVFIEAVVADLTNLELLARSQRIAEELRIHLPASFSNAISILLNSMGEDDGRGGVEGMDGFRHLPFLNFVGLYGLDHPEIALNALESMTLHFSAERDIRYFLMHHPNLTLPRMRQWANHSDWRLRRLASEGTRPRLPWAIRLKAFINDPSIALEIIEPLHTDPHPVVRRSVANHLNDVSKDHPDTAVATAKRWWANGEDGSRWIVKHGLRTLIKQGNPGALTLLGFSGEYPPQALRFTLTPQQVILGGAITFHAELHCREAATLSIDYAVHHQKKNGSLSPKVFKLSRRKVAPGEIIRLEKIHPLRPITTRTFYPGTHRIVVLVNGQAVCEGTFELKLP